MENSSQIQVHQCCTMPGGEGVQDFTASKQSSYMYDSKRYQSALFDG